MQPLLFAFCTREHVLGFFEGRGDRRCFVGARPLGKLKRQGTSGRWPKGTKPAMERDVSLALALLGVLPPRVTVAARLIMFKKSHRVRNGAFSPPLPT